MNHDLRWTQQSPARQGPREKIAYTVDTSEWNAATPTGPNAILYDAAGEDVSGTYLSGACSVADEFITGPVVQGLLPSTSYTLLIEWWVGQLRYGALLEIEAQAI